MEKMPEPPSEPYRCDLCEYTTTCHGNYNKHLKSVRHNKKVSGFNGIYECSHCNYQTVLKYNYDEHMSSKLHEKKMHMVLHNLNPNQCENCFHEFNSKSSLWRHKKNCKPQDHSINTSANESENSKTTENESENSKTTANESKNSKTIVNDDVINVLVKQNDEWRNMFMAQQTMLASQQNLVLTQTQQMATIVNTLVTNGISNNNLTNTNTKTNNSHNTTNNQTFNINYFLNEHCKNAMNIDEFAKMLNCNAKDIEENRQLSFTEHVTKHLMDGIEKCTVETRPIHCSDAKREKMHVKTSEGWVSGKESEVIIRRIVALIDKMIWDAAREWAIANPSCMNLDTVAFNKYIEIKQSIIGPASDAQEDKFMKKVMKALAEVTIIDKEHFSS